MNKEKYIKTILSVKPANPSSRPSYEYLEQLVINQATNIILLKQERDKYKSIVEELKKDIEIYNITYLRETYEHSLADYIEYQLDKIKELEEGNSNE